MAWANGVGIDVGTQAWWWPQPKTAVGHHIVRRNVLEGNATDITAHGPNNVIE